MPHSTKATPPTSKTDWKRLAAMTDEEIHINAVSDPDNPPLTPEQIKRMRRVVPRGNGFYGPPPPRRKP